MARPRATSTEEIIAAAARLFREHGYHNTSLDDIAEAANVSKPTVYQYAKSKQWILDQTLLRVMNDVSTGMRRWDPDESLDQQLERYLRFNIDLATNMRVFFGIMFSEESEVSPEVRERFRGFAHDITEHFAALLKIYDQQNQLPIDADIGVLANLYVSMFVSLYRWYDADGPVTPDELVHMLRQMIVGTKLGEPSVH